MNKMKLRVIGTSVASALLFAFGTNAMADTTTDIVNALVSKGVLTEEEGALLTNGREGEKAGQEKAMKKAGKVTVSDAIDKATIYGDVRVRYEERSGSGHNGSTTITEDETRDRARYKMTLGVKTEAGNWYGDIAAAMGANGRSDNATFGKSASDNINDKEQLYIKRAMFGFKATDWLKLEAGRMDNPLYTTPMVWDADLTFEGLAEKVNYKLGNADVFVTLAQAQYQGDRKNFSKTDTSNTITTELFAYQGGLKYAFSDTSSAKAALTFTDFSHNTSTKSFVPGLGNDKNSVAKTATATTSAAAVNDIRTLELPVELNFMTASNVGVRVFGDYVKNLDGDDRAANAAKVSGKNIYDQNDDSAWMLGVGLASAKDLKTFEANKMAKGDWSVRMWYQDVGVYAVDPNAVDSDYMDSRVNMKGYVLKGQYNVEDNVFINLSAGHAKRKNNDFAAAGAAQDIALNLKDYDLYQIDLTYKF